MIIAALKQEMAPLLHDSAFTWKANHRIPSAYGAWEDLRVALICGGMGAKPAALATTRGIDEFKPTTIISAGIAGALVPGMHVGMVVKPATVLNPSTGTRYQVAGGEGVLVTASEVAGEQGKRLLARHFGADCADMEATAVAAVAQEHGIKFIALKSISDEFDFEMPDLNQFITKDGRFQTRQFVIFMLTRPRLWPSVRQLAQNSRIASLELCRSLRNLILQEAATNQAEPAGRPRESQPAR